MQEEEKQDVKKNPLKKIKETIEDKEEQLAFISVVVRFRRC